jgi:hypothetical protein
MGDIPMRTGNKNKKNKKNKKKRSLGCLNSTSNDAKSSLQENKKNSRAAFLSEVKRNAYRRVGTRIPEGGAKAQSGYGSFRKKGYSCPKI